MVWVVHVRKFCVAYDKPPIPFQKKFHTNYAIILNREGKAFFFFCYLRGIHVQGRNTKRYMGCISMNSSNINLSMFKFVVVFTKNIYLPLGLVPKFLPKTHY